MKKFLIITLILTLAITSVSAKGFKFKFNKEAKAVEKTYTASTEHFDIIYSESSEKAADAIYKNCERIYQEVSDLLGYEDNISIPVYIDSENQILNGYETQWPYNRIVIYDTTSQIGSLSNLTKQLVSIFKHELTHALQFEVKPNKILKIGSKVFGDWFSLQGLQLYPSYVEGAAVMAESLEGNGRLNDNATMQRLKQAKIENTFPSFFQSTGVRDTYPGGDLYYLFGGQFTDYLRTTYGEDKLREFYNQTGRLSWVELTGFKFTKTFGKQENLTWLDFFESVEIPSNYLDPQIISESSRFKTIKLVGEDFYVLNSAENSIQKYSDYKLSKLQKVSSAEYSLSFGEDLSYLTLVNSNKKTAMILFDCNGVELKRFDGYRDGTIVNSNGNTFYVLYRNESQETYIDLYDKNFEKTYTLDLGWGVTAADFCSPMNEVAAFLTSFNGKKNITLFNVATLKTVIAENSENLNITSINPSPTPEDDWLEDSFDEIAEIHRGLLTFSWTTDGQSSSLVRYGEMHLKKIGLVLSMKQSLSNIDINGSIDHPILKDNKVTYIGRFFDHDNICQIDSKSLKMSEKEIVPVMAYSAKTYEEQFGEVEITHRAYNPTKYFWDGTLIPLSINTLEDEGIPLGLTFITVDPSEKWNYVGSLGYTPKTRQYGALGLLAFEYNNFAITGQIELAWPIAQTDGYLKLAYETELKNPNKTLSVSNTLQEHSNYKAFLLSDIETLALKDTLTAGYSNVWMQGTKVTDNTGYQIQASASIEFNKSRTNVSDWTKATKSDIDATVAAIYDFPSLGLANYAVIAQAHTIGTKPDYAIGQVEVMPLCLEIQNGFSFMGLYFNRFVLDLYGTGKYDLNTKKLNVSAQAYAYLTMSEAIGMLSKCHFDLGVSLDYNLTEKEPEVGIYFDLNLGSIGIKSNTNTVREINKI